jgi:hypothetical protein
MRVARQHIHGEQVDLKSQKKQGEQWPEDVQSFISGFQSENIQRITNQEILQERLSDCDRTIMATFFCHPKPVNEQHGNPVFLAIPGTEMLEQIVSMTAKFRLRRLRPEQPVGHLLELPSARQGSVSVRSGRELDSSDDPTCLNQVPNKQ